MKKLILSATVLFLMSSKVVACSWYDPDYEYFNLFTQSIIKDKTYLPFLHTLSNRFYGHEHFEIPSENIESWQKFFGNNLSYVETQTLVEKIPMNDLNSFKKGNSGNTILSKLGSYQKYAEAIDYLIEAKYLEPFMRINYVESPDSFYFTPEQNDKNATKLDYAKTVSALTSLYNAAKNPEIKLRYGYQLVRFNHYTRNYEASTQAFKKYVKPLQLKTAPYFLALDQLAGAQRGLKMTGEANWNFFQVFKNSKSRKESAFISMQLTDSASFNNLLKRAQTPEDKNMAYFLLGYEDYSNPILMMEKMYDNDPNSEILKVLAARSVNELERSYLPIYFNAPTKGNSKANSADQKTSDTVKDKVEISEVSFWQKIKNFFNNLFSSNKNESSPKGSGQSDDQLLNNPNRIPFYTQNQVYGSDDKSANFINDFENLTSKIKEKSADEFWQITDAYLSFLKKDYEKSKETLDQIKTTNPEYLTQINRMKMLNDIVSQPEINSGFEDHLMKDYKDFFAVKVPKKETDSLAENYGYDEYSQPSTNDFLRDILANRYFIQGDDAKSFLMNNQLSDLRYNPNLDLTKKLEVFCNKKDKTNFEKEIIAKNINEVGNPEAFFNVIYGDFAIRSADFASAKKYYEKGEQFSGLPLPEGRYDYATDDYKKYTDASKLYNGFNNISGLIFGHNVWESYQSDAAQSMKAEDFVNQFPQIKSNMTKLELATAVLDLQKIGNGKDEKGAKANQLIGNLLYNTSILGYFRQVFVMDFDNANGGKYYFGTTDSPFQYYYKNYSNNVFIKPDNFDLAVSFYNKALTNSNDHEQKARILFQMASAEQGKYYQYEANNSPEINYDDPDYSKKQEDYMKNMASTKNTKYRTYFAELKKNYVQTQTSKALQTSCSYYDYFMKKN
ncbi:hypothetical protein [Kaistella jeonii]|uniref:Gliding motility protein n=1 Tax=Kaistella jeonii TaxID=266749 RepID=A0A0C1FD82_9FLAO|nr:hypothetical protein [Kaistella jeonii]KIA89783.1 hypothetical protein OA86_03930 [Kaistella jeonii]SFB86420.1 hypothetical protein SAMN05421876_103106 [Kaistella jeonii]VEI96014.1 Uncharacterised protein [Kaistella jeonii]